MKKNPWNLLQIVVIDDIKKNADTLIERIKQQCENLKEKIETHVIFKCKDLDKKLLKLQNHSHIFIFIDLKLDDWEIDGELADGWLVLKHVLHILPLARTVLYSAVSEKNEIKMLLEKGVYDIVSKTSINDTSTGILQILTQFAVVERRLRDAMQLEKASVGETDPLSHLLMKVRVGLLILGPHGKIWFQNKYNQELNRCIKAEGDICHRLFHGWKDYDKPCPWCPTMEAMRTKEAKRRDLILPLRTADNTENFELACLDLASEPLWSDFEPTQGKSAGAIESNIVRTAAWRAKSSHQRTLDILATIVDMLTSSPSNIRINIYGISCSELLYRTLVVCEFYPANQYPVLERDVQFMINETIPGWTGQIEGPGPASECRCNKIPLEDIGPFPYVTHPANKKNNGFLNIVPSKYIQSFPRSSLYEIQDSGNDPSWYSTVLYNQNNRPIALIEIGITSQNATDESLFQKAVAGNLNLFKTDLCLYLDELVKTVELVRDEMVQQRTSSLPELTDFSNCSTRETLWSKVDEIITEFGKAMNILPHEIWWHYRDLHENMIPGGQVQYSMQIPSDYLSTINSPYVHSLDPKYLDIPIPEPSEWKTLRSKLSKDPDALEGFLDPSHPSRNGSWLCRITDSRRLKHVDLASEDPNSQEHNLPFSIRSFGDFPVGDDSHPFGTFHIQSTDDDLFPEPAIQYIEALVGSIERNLMGLELKMMEGLLNKEIQCLKFEKFLRRATNGHLMRLIELSRELLNSTIDTDQEQASLIQALANEVQFLKVASALIERGEPSREDINPIECNVEQELISCIEEYKSNIKVDPIFKDIDSLKIFQLSPNLSTLKVLADVTLFREVILLLLSWTIRLYELKRQDAHKQPLVKISLEQKDNKGKLELIMHMSLHEPLKQAITSICKANADVALLFDILEAHSGTTDETLVLFELSIAVVICKYALLYRTQSSWEFTQSGNEASLSWFFAL